jgi:hypothetical protein
MMSKEGQVRENTALQQTSRADLPEGQVSTAI